MWNEYLITFKPLLCRKHAKAVSKESLERSFPSKNKLEKWVWRQIKDRTFYVYFYTILVSSHLFLPKLYRLDKFLPK